MYVDCRGTKIIGPSYSEYPIYLESFLDNLAKGQ